MNIFVYASRNDLLILDRTNSSGDDAGHNLITNSVEEFKDAFTTATDQIVLEFDTFENLSVSVKVVRYKKFLFQMVVDKVIQNYQLFLLHLHLERTQYYLQPQKISVQLNP